MNLKQIVLKESHRVSDIRGNPYLFYADRVGYPVSEITLGDIFNYLNKHDSPLLRRLAKYLGQHDSAVVIPSMAGDYVYQITLRAIDSSNFHDIGSAVFPFNLLSFDKEFRYRDYIIAVEGILDCLSYLQFYPFVVATLSSSMTSSQIEFISRITDNVILSYDNDERGQEGMYLDNRKLSERGVDVEFLLHPSGISDAGDLAKLELQGNKIKYQAVYNYYKSKVNSLVGCNNAYK